MNGRAISTRVAVAVLLAGAAASVAFACCGAEKSLDFMKYYAAIGTVGALAAMCLVAAAFTWRRPAVLALHLGLALVLGGWTYNELAGPKDGWVRLRAGQYGGVGGVEAKPQLLLRLEEFKIDRWPDTGTVRQYTSRVKAGPYADTDDGLEEREISVNHPLVMGGWWIYQSSFEELQNPHTGEPLYFTILQCVKDVGLPFVFLGGALLILGALWYAFRKFRTSKPRNPETSKPRNFESYTHSSSLGRSPCLSIAHWRRAIRRCRTCTSS